MTRSRSSTSISSRAPAHRHLRRDPEDAARTLGRVTRHLRLAAFGILLSAATADAQEMRFHYPAPPESAFRVIKDVTFGRSASGPLQMDVYRPASGTTHPTLIFFNTATGTQRSNPFYASWARIAASHGITAVLPDLGMESFVQDFVSLHAYLAKGSGGEHGIDKDAVALYAGSGNAWRALPIVQDVRTTVVKSAVIYYGAGEVQQFRADLPVLFVRAGLDRPSLNKSMDGLVAAALSQNAPVRLLNYASGYHAFEIRNDEEQTRRVIDETIEFVKTTTSAAYQASLRRGVLEATAAGHVSGGRFKEAAGVYAQLAAKSPENATLRLAYGEALLGDRQFTAACAEFEKLKGKGLGYRDLGVPAARACMQKGDAEAAIAWLQSIPERFRPAELRNDPIFAPIRDRAEFRALFENR
jgi:dienelactone hydrolase